MKKQFKTPHGDNLVNIAVKLMLVPILLMILSFLIPNDGYAVIYATSFLLAYLIVLAVYAIGYVIYANFYVLFRPYGIKKVRLALKNWRLSILVLFRPDRRFTSNKRQKLKNKNSSQSA